MSEKDSPDRKPGARRGDDRPEIRYVPVEYVHTGRTDEDEIDLLDLIKTLWDGRRIILMSVIACFFLGLFIFFFSAREYESEAILIQEQTQQSVGNNALLRQFGGGEVNVQNEGIPASLYPRIIESVEFQLQLANREIEFGSLDTTLTAMDYFNNHYSPPVTKLVADGLIDYTVKLPFTLYRHIRNLFRDDSSMVSSALPGGVDSRFMVLNPVERRALSMMQERMTLEQEGSLLTFTVRMPDANAAAELNHYVIEQIQEYITDYQIEKYRQTLEYVETQFEDAQERYEEAQLALARFNDQNVQLTTAVARTRLEDLQNRRNITYNVYNNLAQEVERSRTRLQEETPIFNVLQRPRLPHSAGGRFMLIPVVFILLGGFVGVSIVFGRQAWQVVSTRILE
ncbi:MAG: Wzz/FepE/Etk N-terminal domain-containing protein [Balneolaceae bacterium]